MEGLASSLAQQPQTSPSQVGPVPSLQEVVALLMQGTDPSKLEEMGVPVELIMEAISVIEQQMAAEKQQSAQNDGGLASSLAGM